MLPQVALFHSFSWLSSIPVYICTTSSLSIHLPRAFRLLLCCAIVNRVSLNAGVHIALPIRLLSGYVPGAGLLDHMAVLVF